MGLACWCKCHGVRIHSEALWHVLHGSCSDNSATQCCKIPAAFGSYLLPTIKTTISESTWHKSSCTGCCFSLADLMRQLLFGWCGRHLRMERSSWWLVGSGRPPQAHPSATALSRPCWQICRWANTSPDHHSGSPSRRVNCMQQQHTVTSEGSLQQRLSFGNSCFRRW